jgi:C4-dicarboxylate-specific signal transduction histidine kinase
LWVYDTLTIEFDPITMKPEGVGVLIDINDRKIAAIQLVEADKMASFGRVLAGVTHEISQPLNFIKIAIFNLRRLISQAPQDQVRVMDKLEQLAANADHAAGIVLQMRVFGRASLTGQEPASLSEVVSGLELMIGSQLKLDGVLLDTTGCAVGREMIAEPKLLVQVLMNLLINGRDSINNRIAAGDTTPGRLAVSATREEDDLVITVDDNGTGIPDLALPKLFEPFFTTKPEMQGTGLGLSISYGIIHDMGGSLVAENLVHGARFTITIPAALS